MNSTELNASGVDLDALYDAVTAAKAEGNYRHAISLLSQSRADAQLSDIDKQLMNLRIEGFTQEGCEPVSWSPDCDLRYTDSSGLPEIDAADLSADALRAGILGKGGLIVRGLMQPERINSTRECIRNALVARRNLARGDEGAEQNPWYSRPEQVAGGPVQFGSMGKDQQTETGSVWAVDSPPSAAHMIEFYREIGLVEMLDEYFGEEACLSVRKWVLRCVAPNNGAQSGWHQDGQFMGENIRTVNLWVALSECGDGAPAPGIEILADNSREIYPTGTHGAPFDWTVGQGLVDELNERHEVVRPHFQPGDAVFFDHYNLHRTAFGLDHTELRYAVESWFFATSLAPAKQQPLLF